MKITFEQYEELYRTLEYVNEDWKEEATKAANKILDGIARYKSVSKPFGIPWVFVGLIHQMESDCNFFKQILNGQRWNKKTTIVPSGLGPWNNWEEAALEPEAPEALCKYTGEWSLGRMAKELEAFNGGGYLKRDKLSPYLWSGSQHGVGSGKYAELEENDYRPTYYPSLVSDQVGAMCILKVMESLKVNTGF